MLATERLYREVPAWTDQLAALLDGADPRTPVPTTPDWTLTGLAEHVGFSYRWMMTIVATRATAPVRRADILGRPKPDDPAELPAWLREGAADLVDAVRSTGSTTPVWSWAGGTQPAEWWLQRNLYELVVHTADAALALDRPVTLDPELAAAGIDEWLTILPFIHADDLPDALPPGRSLHLHAVDGGEWLLRGTPDGLDWERGHTKANVAVRGPAGALYLLLSRRLSPDAPALEIHGDRPTLETWLSTTKF